MRLQPWLALGVVAVGAIIALALYRPRIETEHAAVLAIEAGTSDSDVERFVLATMWSPTAGFERSERFRVCLEEALGKPIELVQRETYAEGNAQLLSGNADLGLICTGATANTQRKGRVRVTRHAGLAASSSVALRWTVAAIAVMLLARTLSAGPWGQRSCPLP